MDSLPVSQPTVLLKITCPSCRFSRDVELPAHMLGCDDLAWWTKACPGCSKHTLKMVVLPSSSPVTVKRTPSMIMAMQPNLSLVDTE